MKRLRLVVATLFVAAAAPWAIADEEQPTQPLDAAATASETSETQPAAESVEPAVIPTRRIGNVDWHTDYRNAYREAKEQRKMLLVFFRDDRNAAYYDNFERTALADANLAADLNRVVRVVIPASSTDYGRPLTNGGRERLLDHPSFSFMYRSPGLAVVDLASVGSGVYGHVVSAHPFLSHRAESAATVRIILTLPPGSITQRALIYAMRTHPSAPQGANYGMFSGYLGYLANNHSVMMTSMGVGHHNWGARAGQVTASTGRSPSEVAAATGNSYMLDAAYDLVTQWRNSSAHWVIMSPPASVYALDMVQSPGGGWFGTGIFAR